MTALAACPALLSPPPSTTTARSARVDLRSLLLTLDGFSFASSFHCKQPFLQTNHTHTLLCTDASCFSHGVLPFPAFQLRGRLLFHYYVLSALVLEVGCEALLYLEVLSFRFRPEVCPVMPILEFRLMLLGKQATNQSSSCASVYTPIPKTNGVMCFGGTGEQ